MSNNELNLESFYQDMATRFRVLGELFGKLGSVEAAQQLHETFLTGDAKSLGQIINLVEVPNMSQMEKNYWLGDVLEYHIAIPRPVEICQLRDDLTVAERQQYLMMLLRHINLNNLVPVGKATLTFPKTPSRIIQPGPFRDELRNA